MPIDKFDLKILEVLQRNSRATLQEVGEQVGLSSTPCWNRIKQMEATGVIQRYTVNVDQAALGYSDTVIVQLTLNSHTDIMIDDFGKALEEIPEVLEAYLVSGDYDYVVRIAVRDTRDYERLLREHLYKIPGIRHSKSSFVLRTLKQSDAPLRPPESAQRSSKKHGRREGAEKKRTGNDSMLDQVFASLPPKRCAKIERPASELAMLKDLREAVERTQEYLEARLGVGQETVSRIERRSDVLLSTLRRYVEAMGGELELIARFSQPRAASHRPPSCQSAYCNKAARGWKEIEIRGSSPVIWSTGEARCQWPRRKRKTVKKRRVPCNLDACVPRKKARALLVGATSVEN